jgi:hypothetical protein
VIAIADRGKVEASARKAKTCAKIDAAMRQIEREIDENGGLYPHNAGRLSQQELLRRARLSSAALQKRTHQALRNQVNAWLRQISKRSVTGSENIRANIASRITQARGEKDTILVRWHEAELEHAIGQEELAKERNRVAELEREVERLRCLLSASSKSSLHMIQKT